MKFIEAIENRYTTKMYDGSKKISNDKINELKETLRKSPSSINSQPWKFTFVNDVKTKGELARASFFNDERVINCDTLVVFSRIDSVKIFENDIAGRLPEGAVEYFNKFVKPKSDHAIKSWFGKQVYLALGVFLSACANMGIDSTPMEGIETETYDTILGNDDYSTLFAVAIGYRDAEDFNQLDKVPKSRKALDDVIRSI